MRRTVQQEKRSIWRPWVVWVVAPLLALVGAKLEAVTLDGMDGVRLAGLCAGVVQGLPGASEVARAVAEPTLKTREESHPRPRAEAAPWSQPEAKPEVVLRIAESAAAMELLVSSRKLVAEGFESARLSGGSPSESVLEAGSVTMDAITKSLDSAPIGIGAPPATSREVAQCATMGRPSRALWWVILPMLSSLVALTASVAGIVRNRPRCVEAWSEA